MTTAFDAGSPYARLNHEAAGRYVRIKVSGHALADKRGRVMAHRAVLYDAIGTGPHPCHWCGGEGLRWDVDRLDPSYLVVDHLDGDGGHNRRGNLVPTHSHCNSNRSVVEKLGIPWSSLGGMAPEARPALMVTGGPNKGAPTKTAYELAEVDAATSPKAGSDADLSTARSSASDPSPTTHALPIRKGLVRWEDLVG